ncbi:MAG TPA: hypothetical protein DCQ56_03330 [Porphyromonadaceae bacterium]|nr:hypothetical protein [Porphyromonadaceae bacterium]
MTVSDASHDMTSGGNSATLFFSSSNLTSSTGTGIASGTGSSKVTIDCSNFDLNTGYITASGAVRIWDVTVTYESGEVIEVPDLYIIGQVNGHDSDPWVPTEGVKMTYNSTNDNYAANIYCTGVNNGTHEGYSLFLFAKSLPYDWNTTSNLYGSGADGSYWPISGQPNESAFGEEIPLYEGSKNSYRLPAGLYTVTVDLDYTGHEYTTKSVKVTKRDVIMTISPNSATFETTKNVTMSSNLTEIGGKIYYTTNGNDPRDPNSGRIEYTGELTIDATTTFKAVAYVGNLYSDVVEKTYTKTPAAPVITPNGGTIYEATQVTITAESGATIYYTTDGNTPTPENGTQYTAPFTVSATTTVKARAYVDDVFSSITTAEFTYSNVTPSTGDFVLVTDASQLVAGNEYIIMTTDKDGYKLAMGDINSNNKGTWTQEFDITGNVGEAGSKVSVNSEATESNSLVNILELEGTNGSWALKQQSAGKYLNISGDDTNINESDSKVNVSFTIYNNNSAKIQGRSDRQILFSDQNDVFGNYATSNAGKSGFEYVYLYTRESNAVQPPVFTPAGGIYNVDVDVTISCPTSGASILYSTDGTNFQAYTEAITVSETTTLYAKAVKGEQESEVASATYTVTTILAALEAGPVQGKSYAISDLIVAKIIDGIVYAKDNNGAAEQTAVDGQIDYLAERVNTKNTDHSNWIAITGLTDDNLTEGSRLTNVVGTLSDAVNFTLAAQSATVDKPNNEELAINQYVPCNFGVSTQTVGGKTYFFAHPQIMEYAYIFAAVWKGNDTFEVPENNAAGLTGSFTADLNGYEDNLKQGTVYEFHAIVKKAAAGGNGAPRRIAGNGGDYEVMLTEGPKKTSDITTAVDELQSGKAVDGVRYVNVAGQVAATPWQGVNIVVTRYTDGSTRTTKVVK